MYRLLEIGELRIKGDEFYDLDLAGGWTDVYDSTIGKIVEEGHLPVRRKIKDINEVSKLKAEIAVLIERAFAFQDAGDKYGVDFILDQLRKKVVAQKEPMCRVGKS
jgi:hypothetical protein